MIASLVIDGGLNYVCVHSRAHTIDLPFIFLFIILIVAELYYRAPYNIDPDPSPHSYSALIAAKLFILEIKKVHVLGKTYKYITYESKTLMKTKLIIF